MTNKRGEGDDRYDLEERTARFGESVITLAKRIPITPVNSPVISQVVRASTSIGANYCEADDAESKKDFRHKISICLKESKECRHFLRMIGAAVPELCDEARKQWREATQLKLIFASIKRSTD